MCLSFKAAKCDYVIAMHYCIWEQRVYFWNIPSDADIYWYNKINPVLLIALCLLLTPFCSLLSVYNSMLFIVECLKWGKHVCTLANQYTQIDRVHPKSHILNKFLGVLFVWLQLTSSNLHYAIFHSDK